MLFLKMRKFWIKILSQKFFKRIFEYYIEVVLKIVIEVFGLYGCKACLLEHLMRLFLAPHGTEPHAATTVWPLSSAMT